MIAITGGNGPLARTLIPKLREGGRQLRILTAQPSTDTEGSHYVTGDIFDITALEELLHGAHQVYHLDILDTLYTRQRQRLYRYNVEGTANVVNVALSMGVGKILLPSTTMSLGDKCQEDLFDETAKWSNPKAASGFGWSMHLAEREIWRGILEGLPAIILHIPVVAGHPSDNSSSAEILNYCMEMDGGYPTGNIHLIDPEDLADWMIRLMDSDHRDEKYILFSHSAPYRELSQIISGFFSRRPPGKELSFSFLKRRALMTRLNFMLKRDMPVLTAPLARALSDTRTFSNQKALQLFPYRFIDMEATIQRYCRDYETHMKSE